jgi:hypothetical protein
VEDLFVSKVYRNPYRGKNPTYVCLSAAIRVEEIEPLVHSCPWRNRQGRHAHDILSLAGRIVERDKQNDRSVLQTH